MDKAVVYTAKVGKLIPAGLDRGAVLTSWPRWSLGVRVANFLFASGMGGSDDAGAMVTPEDPAAQVQVALQRLVTLMEAGGASAQDLVMVRVFLDEPANADAVLAGVGDFFGRRLGVGGYPAFSMVVANTSDSSVVAEIEAWAATDHESRQCASLAAQFRPGAGWAHYAHSARVGSLWFLSAQLPLDSAGAVAGGGEAQQTDCALDNLVSVLRTSDLAASALVRLTVWVAPAASVAMVEESLARFVGAHFSTGDGPAVSILIAPLVEPGALVQIEAVATTGKRRVIGAGTVARPGLAGVVPAVGVVLSDEVDSFVRRFTWPELGSPPHPAERPPNRRPLGEIVFLAAQTGTVQTGTTQTGTTSAGTLVPGGMGEQTTQALENMRAVVETAGGTFADLVQFDIFYRDRSLYADYNRARIAYLEMHNPESAWFAGSGPKAGSSMPDALVEIESIAVIQS